MRVVMTGATGLVGGLVLKHLGRRADIRAITTLSRKEIVPLDARHRSINAPADEWPGVISQATHDVAVCCLGTTLREAGSKEAFVAVDLVAVTRFAQACRAAGVRQFVMVTSVGADERTRNFYLSTKGKAEAAVQQIGFERVDIMRPGLLVGKRKGPLRIGERLAIAVSPITDILTPAVLSRYRSISADTVARAIVSCVGNTDPGIFRHHNDEIRLIQSKVD